MGGMFRIFKPKAKTEAQLRDKLYKHLMLREGVRNYVYKDSLGKPTVGVGHLVRASDNLGVGDKVSTEQIESWLREDSEIALRAARQQAKEIGIETEDFIVALTSVNFQLGTNWTKKFKTSYPALVAGNYRKTIKGIKGSLWARQTPVRVADFVEAIEIAFDNR